MAWSNATSDRGPNPRLTVEMADAPQEPYYLDLLEEKREGEEVRRNLTVEEWRSLDLQLLEETVPEGWRACMAQGTDASVSLARGDGVHIFFSEVLPQSYRILIMTQSGETWVSDVLEREALQSSVTIDWTAETAEVPPLWRAYALQILAALLPTILLEGLLLLAFGFRWRENWKIFLLVNFLTQGALSSILGIFVVRDGFSGQWMLVFFVAQVVITLVEAFIYRRFLRGQPKDRAFSYGVIANTASAFFGWFWIDLMWYLSVAIS